jgi:hypothetical protein
MERFRTSFLFPSGNKNHYDVFETTGTFHVVAAHQRLATLFPDKAPHHTHFGDLIHALQSHPQSAFSFVSCHCCPCGRSRRRPAALRWPVAGYRRHQKRQLRCADRFNRNRQRRQGYRFGRAGFRYCQFRGTCASLDQWCICGRSTQWQLRIGEVEWGISRRTVQRSMGSLPSVRQARHQNSSPTRGG